MPLDIDPALIEQLVQRQAMVERFAPQPALASLPPGELPPSLMAALGAVADGASTYQFLKQGTGTEDNAMFSGANNKPAMTALTVAGTGLAVPLAGRLLRNTLPKSLIDAIVANIGGRSIAAAGSNLDGLRESSLAQSQAALTQPELRHK